MTQRRDANEEVSVKFYGDMVVGFDCSCGESRDVVLLEGEPWTCPECDRTYRLRATFTVEENTPPADPSPEEGYPFEVRWDAETMVWRSRVQDPEYMTGEPDEWVLLRNVDGRPDRMTGVVRPFYDSNGIPRAFRRRDVANWSEERLHPIDPALAQSLNLLIWAAGQAESEARREYLRRNFATAGEWNNAEESREETESPGVR